MHAFHLDSVPLNDIDSLMGELNQKVMTNASKLDQQMQRLFTKIDRLSCNVNVVSYIPRPE